MLTDESVDLTVETPVVLVIFKRTGPVKRVLDVVRRVEPPEVFVIADGPRDHVAGEAEKVREARSFVEAELDWDCTVYRNYAAENMGGPRRIPTGLDWVFDHVDRAIILEEDMLPAPEFFQYCERLLDRYENDERVMEICGNNAGSAPDVDSSYFFSQFHRTMGWATWRRAWNHYDPDLKRWPEMKENDVLRDRYHLDAWAAGHGGAFDDLYENEMEYWDATWQYCLHANDGLTVHPRNNLVVHIGYGADATHTERPPIFERLLLPGLESISFPLDHPDAVEPNVEFEKRYRKYAVGHRKTVLNLLDRALYKLLPESVIRRIA